MTTDAVQQQVVEVLREHMLTSRVDEKGHAWACCLCGEDLPGGPVPPNEGSLLRHQAQALADAGLLPAGRTEWSWLTPGGSRIRAGYSDVAGEVDARNAVEMQGGTAQSRTHFTAPEPTPWRDA